MIFLGVLFGYLAARTIELFLTWFVIRKRGKAQRAAMEKRKSEWEEMVSKVMGKEEDAAASE